jgi:Acetyltransferase (GNAT) domain
VPTAQPAGSSLGAGSGSSIERLIEGCTENPGLPFYSFDPLEDLRWNRLVTSHPAASIFHTSGWLQALRRTYGYQPVAVTTSKPGESLQNGLVFCLVRSWLTGKRAVSLPFSDHCEPLVDRPGQLAALIHALRAESERKGCRKVEVRPAGPLEESQNVLRVSRGFFLHRLDLQPGREHVYHGLHKDCVQRKIRRAERERLTSERGRTDELLGKFYRLLTITRNRHHLPPQPLSWFRNLIECLGNRLNLIVASKNGAPVAAIMTMRFRDVLTYKYGCSDHRFHSYGGMQLVLWRAIEEAIAEALSEFDMGRSDLDQPGLITFKDRWGAARSRLTYWEWTAKGVSAGQSTWRLHVARKVFALTPTSCLSAAGNLFYKHIG